MGHFGRLVDSGKDLWRNPSLLGVLVLQYAIVTLLGILFGLMDIALIASLNGGTLGPLLDQGAPQEALIGAVWNAKTAIALGVVGGVQFLLLTAVASWFTAGAYGMIRNLLLDGSTALREFRPMARRFVWRIFRFTLLRYALLAVLTAPLVFSFLGIAGTTSGLVTPGQMAFFTIALIAFVVIGLFVMLLLLYGDAVIVFEDAGALRAAKRTLLLVRRHPWTSLVTGLLSIALLALFAIIISFLLAPLRAAKQAVVASEGLGIIGNVLLVAAGTVVVIFIFRTYRSITGGVVRTASYRTRKKA